MTVTLRNCVAWKLDKTTSVWVSGKCSNLYNENKQN